MGQSSKRVLASFVAGLLDIKNLPNRVDVESEVCDGGRKRNNSEASGLEKE